jgi:hypothetical protein
MQGDFDKMQGGVEVIPVKTDKISMGLRDLSLQLEQRGYPQRQGGREDIWIRFPRLCRSEFHQDTTMPQFIPSGYLSIREALNHLGRELFSRNWTGEEHAARCGLISEEERSRIKDLPPARGGGAPGSHARSRRPKAPPARATPTDPSDPFYQAAYRANQRYKTTCGHLRSSLERGALEAAILDPFTGTLHRAPASLWRRHDADRLIARGQAPIRGSRNTGLLLVKDFAEAKGRKPIPQAKMHEAVKILKEETATEYLTRPQQKDLLRKTFPSHTITERQFDEIFRAVPTSRGRPKKSDK